MSSQTIAVDIDDVLASSAEGFVDYSNKRWGTHLTVDDYDERWAIMWGVDIEEENRRAHEIYSSGTVGNFKNHDEALPVLKRLKEKYKLVITTSRARHLQEDTLKWIDRHYKNIFDEIHFAGYYDKLSKESYKQNKAELCRSIGADYLIDDHPKHCIPVSAAGIKTLLFGNYAWNKVYNLPSDIVRVKDWQEVAEYFGV